MPADRRPRTGVRFGVGPAGLRAADGRRLEQVARASEDLGFSTICLGDHLDGRLAPGPAAVAIAGWTERLIPAVHVYCNDLRPPAVLAEEIASVAALVDGRFEAGIGAGWLRDDYDRAGVPFDPAPERVARVGASLAEVRSTLADRGAPPVRIMVGGGGRRVLTMAAEHADIVGLNVKLPQGVMGEIDLGSATAQAAREKVELVRAAAGVRFADLELQVVVHAVEIGEGSEPLRRAAANLGLTEEEAASSPHVLAGSVGQVTERVAELQASLGIGYFCIPADVLEAFAPVVEATAR